MFSVSNEYTSSMKADKRRIYGKVQIDYTDPFLDQSISVAANEEANISFPDQTADNVQEPAGKIASFDGSWVLDGTYVLAPTDGIGQMGWWGSQLAGSGGPGDRRRATSLSRGRRKGSPRGCTRSRRAAGWRWARCNRASCRRPRPRTGRRGRPAR